MWERGTEISAAQGTDSDEKQADEDVKRIVDSRPSEMLSGKPARETGCGLIQIDHPERGIEYVNRGTMSDQDDDRADHAGSDMEEVVCRRAARRASMFGDHEAQNADQNQDGGKYRQRQEVQIIKNHGESRLGCRPSVAGEAISFKCDCSI